MPESLGGRVKSMLIIALMIIITIQSSITAFNVTSFSDGMEEKTIIFTDVVNEGMMFLSIPRATNLSEASINIAGNASVVSDRKSFSEFSEGEGFNISKNNDINLVMKEDWWNGCWTYRVPLNLVSQTNYFNSIIEKNLNLTEILNGIGLENRTVNSASLRIVERLASGALAPYNATLNDNSKFLLPEKTQELPGYRAAGNARVNISWLVPGVTSISIPAV